VAERTGRDRVQVDRVVLRVCENDERAKGRLERLLGLGFEVYRRSGVTWCTAGYGVDFELRRRHS
jgi:hypothetical protein